MTEKKSGLSAAEALREIANTIDRGWAQLGTRSLILKTIRDRAAGLEEAAAPDWTRGEDGRSNTSTPFENACAAVETIIRNGAHDLIGGHAGTVARTVVAQLAHVHGFSPAPKTPWCDACKMSHAPFAPKEHA